MPLLWTNSTTQYSQCSNYTYVSPTILEDKEPFFDILVFSVPLSSGWPSVDALSIFEWQDEWVNELVYKWMNNKWLDKWKDTGRVNMTKDFRSTEGPGNNSKNDLHEACLGRAKRKRLTELGQIIEGLQWQETFFCLFILFNKNLLQTF